MLLVLQTLTPVERAVFVLREVFDVPYDEIADAVDRTPAAVRQVAHRAREHVAARRPRQRVDRGEHAAVLERFRAAAATGDLQLAGRRALARRRCSSPTAAGCARRRCARSSAARRCCGSSRRSPRRTSTSTCGSALVGGQPGLVVMLDGVVDAVITIEAVDGVVGSLYFVRNPDKLTRLEREVRLAR